MRSAIRRIWHDLYYRFMPKSGVRFAMTCREAVDQVNLPDPSSSRVTAFRLGLHLSLCRACHLYFWAASAIRNGVRRYPDDPRSSIDLDRLNRELLKKFARPDR